MKQIYKNSNRLLLLVNQLMDFRKLEYGAMTLKLSRVNIGTFLTSQIDSFSDLLHKKEQAMVLRDQFSKESGRISNSFKTMMNDMSTWSRGRIY